MTDRELFEQALKALETNNQAWKHLADSGDAGFWEVEEQPFYETSVKAITALRAALAQEQDAPPVKESLQAEPATTQQPADEAPPSDYRRGYWAGFAIGKREGRIEAEDAALKAQEQAEPVQEPVAWMQPHKPDQIRLSPQDGWLPLVFPPPKRQPLNGLEGERLLEQVIGSLPVARNLVRAVERAHGIIGSEIRGDSHQTLDDAMQQPRAMAQAYENGYKAGAAAERERIIQFLTEMQRQVGDAHNHYGVAAVRIKEGV